MPAAHYLQSRNPEINPKRSKPLSRAEISAEIERIDTALNILCGLIEEPSADPWVWKQLSQVSVPVALRSLRHYRQRLTRMS